MTDAPDAPSAVLARIREIALLLPGVEERPSQSQPTFFVAGEQFAQVRKNDRGDGWSLLCVRGSDDDDEHAMPLDVARSAYGEPVGLERPGWVAVALTGDPDWALIEDRIARSWELAAPDQLLEAGGR